MTKTIKVELAGAGAFGIKHLDMPLTPEKVWRAMESMTPVASS